MNSQPIRHCGVHFTQNCDARKNFVGLLVVKLKQLADFEDRTIVTCNCDEFALSAMFVRLTVVEKDVTPRYVLTIFTTSPDPGHNYKL